MAGHHSPGEHDEDEVGFCRARSPVGLIEVSRRRLDARRKGLGRRRVKVAKAETQALAEAKAAWFRAVGRLTASWSKQRQREKHVESVVVGRSEASGRPCLSGSVAEQTN